MQACKNCIHHYEHLAKGGHYCKAYAFYDDKKDYIHGTIEREIKIEKRCIEARDGDTCQAYQEKKKLKISMFKNLFSRA